MDDDELTQEILDQFDLICTQHQYENVPSHSNGGLSKPNLHPEKSSNGLTRSTSLDTKLGGTVQVPHFPLNEKVSNASRDEVESLKKEVSVLREELYMKLGELATIKESASRAKATDSDTISKLESHLASERNDFQRKLSELNAQIAFREADYRLVCSELARIKEEAAVNKQLLNERSVEYSPASQILVSLTSPNPDPISKQKARTPGSRLPSTDFHLPAPVTPIPSRRHRVPHGLVWDVNVPSNSEDPLKSTTVQQSDINEVLPVNEAPLSSAPRKRQRYVMSPDIQSPQTSPERLEEHQHPTSVVDACVETTDLSNSPTCNRPLRYRIISPAFSITQSSHLFTNKKSDLLSDLLSLSISVPHEEKDGNSSDTDSQTPVMIPTCFTKSEDSAWLTSDYYLTGINKLLPNYSDILSETTSSDNGTSHLNMIIKRFSTSLPYLLLRVEEQFKACISTLLDCGNQSKRISGKKNSNTQDTDDRELLDDNEEEDKENEQLDVEISDIDPNEMSYLGEDPFAGAPASQVVTSLTFPSQPKPFSKQVKERSISMQRNKSCPSNIEYSESSSSSTVVTDVPKTNNTDNFLLYRQMMIDQSVRGINQLRYLVTTLVSYCPLPSKLVHYMDDNLSPGDEDGDDSTLVIINEFQCLIRMISSVLCRFINKLVDVFIQNEQENHLLTSSTTTCFTPVTCSIDSTSHKSSQNTSKHNAFPSLSVILPLITGCLNLAALFAVFIRIDIHAQRNPVDKVCGIGDQGNSSNQHPWLPELLSCIIITSEACFGHNDKSSSILLNKKHPFMRTESNNSTVGNFIKNRPVITLKPLISFLRFWRNMISQRHWNGGHCTDSLWWDTGCERMSTDSTSLKDIRQQYIEKLFGSSIRCRLLAICVWICQFYDQFTATINCTTTTSTTADELNDTAEMQRIELLNEFSGMVAVLAQRDDVVWPDSCCCKAKVYSTLVHLSDSPLKSLMTIPTSVLTDPFYYPQLQQQQLENASLSSADLLFKQKTSLIAFGQLTRALIGLLWRHGDQNFQSYTDCLPDYFCLITNLTRWIQLSKQRERGGRFETTFLPYQHNDMILRPELIEELYDFESGVENFPYHQTG
ncbi:unnamed protein product [Trichobilharzia szidati]|nr:unnamed protein product [Trichobilharzia szidati]